jgi:hypothetical protein
MKKGLLILTVALMTLAPMSASAAAVRGFVGVKARTGDRIGDLTGVPAYYGYGYPAAGQIKLDTKVKNAEVFIDGAFAGMTQQTKSMHLRPGSYNIEIRELGQTKFAEQVYVVAGKTLHLAPAVVMPPGAGFSSPPATSCLPKTLAYFRVPSYAGPGWAADRPAARVCR